MPFGFFEFAAIGFPLTLAAILYMMLVGKHFLPKGGAVGKIDDDDATAEAKAGDTSALKNSG